MKPLLTTVRALRELATGLSPDAIAGSAVLHEYDGELASVLVSVEDTIESQRVVLIRDQNVKERLVPEGLSGFRRKVLSRMASFSERALTLPLSLPNGWSQFKHDNLVTFFALANGDVDSTRWIAEVVPGERADVIFWRTTNSSNKTDLVDFAASEQRTLQNLDADWAAAIDSAQRAVAAARVADESSIELQAPSAPQSLTKGWTLDHWLTAVSDDQRAFIEAPTSKSIRLRGPAGSGKTLALELKALREIVRARAAGEELRVLVVTHSWALATQIANSIDSMGVSPVRELDVYPLLEVAQAILPSERHGGADFTVIGEDSYSGKRAQLDEILELLNEFADGEWITYRSGVSEPLRRRIDSTDEDDRLALAWDLLIEFGSVIGAAAIFPGAGAEGRYFQLPRANWMLPLETRPDLRVVFLLYTKYMENLDARSLVTSDQVLADFLSYLETHAWNRTRKTEGYDLVFVDEFHLFSPLERQVLHFLTRDVAAYPRVFMAVDPRQSPSEAFIGLAADETWSTSGGTTDDALGDFTSFELTTVHRFTPQVLELIKHVHHQFPTFELGQPWEIDFAAVESAKEDGPLPKLIAAASRVGEETDIYRAVQELYPRGRLALAVVDTRQWQRFSELAARVGQSAKFHVSTISGKTDIEGLGYRHRGLVVGPAEYLAGLQFDTVLVAGIPDLQVAAPTMNERRRLLSLLYLALSRAEKEVRVFVNDEDGGTTETLQRAVALGLVEAVQGSLV